MMPRTVERRRRLRADQDGLCYWCGMPMQLGHDARHFTDYPWATTLEHLLPKGHPDHDQPWAIVGAHQYCNLLRARVEWDVFLDHVHSATFAELYRRYRPRASIYKLLKKALREIHASSVDVSA